MKFSKVKLGIATLATFVTFLGFAVWARADSGGIKQYNRSITTHFEVGSNHGSNSDITSTKETIDLRIQKDDLTIDITGSHTDYSGKLEGKKVKEDANSLRVGIGKKVNDGLFLYPYTEMKDDIDPLREFSDDDMYAIALGLSGECLLKKPITLVGDFKASALKKGDFDFSTNLGFMYYFNDDWISLRGVNWGESLRDTNTAMVYLLFHHNFNEKIKTTIHGGYGKEYGSRRETVSDAGGNLSYKLNERLTLDFDYSYYKSKTKKHIGGFSLTWKF